MGLKSHSRQGCKGFSSFSAVFSTAEKSRANSEPGAARPGAQKIKSTCKIRHFDPQKKQKKTHGPLPQVLKLKH